MTLNTFVNVLYRTKFQTTIIYINEMMVWLFGSQRNLFISVSFIKETIERLTKKTHVNDNMINYAQQRFSIDYFYIH